jgi:hypothetical protein
MGRHFAAVIAVFLLFAAGAQAETSVPAPPSAKDFASVFLGVTNAYAQAHAEAARFVHAHCVEAARGRYMCAYATVTRGQPLKCHLMQARWTPNAASGITVTLASRTPLCGSLRQALDSLR